MKTAFRVGDIVKHKGSFLRSTGWYTDVPINGRVESVDEGKPAIVQVVWSDGHESRILEANIMLASKPDYTNM